MSSAQDSQIVRVLRLSAVAPGMESFARHPAHTVAVRVGVLVTPAIGLHPEFVGVGARMVVRQPVLGAVGWRP